MYESYSTHQRLVFRAIAREFRGLHEILSKASRVVWSNGSRSFDDVTQLVHHRSFDVRDADHVGVVQLVNSSARQDTVSTQIPIKNS